MRKTHRRLVLFSIFGVGANHGSNKLPSDQYRYSLSGFFLLVTQEGVAFAIYKISDFEVRILKPYTHVINASEFSLDPPFRIENASSHADQFFGRIHQAKEYPVAYSIMDRKCAGLHDYPPSHIATGAGLSLSEAKPANCNA